MMVLPSLQSNLTECTLLANVLEEPAAAMFAAEGADELQVPPKHLSTNLHSSGG
jgi:hypothetical protein